MWRVTAIAVAKNEGGRLALVATAGNRGSRDAVWHLPELDAAAWSQLGEPPGGVPEFPPLGPARPAIAANADGRFEVVTIGSDGVTGKVWHASQNASTGDWSDWESLDVEAVASARLTIGPRKMIDVTDHSGSCGGSSSS